MSEKKAKVKSIHSGHRERIKNKYLRFGCENFENHELLELILYYAIPRKDTNELAHTLLNRFGSLHAVFQASISELETIPGIGKNAAILIHLFSETFRAIEYDKNKKMKFLNSVHELGIYLRPYFFGRTNEQVVLLCLDGKKKVLSCGSIFEGSFNSAQISIKRVAELAVSTKATFVVIAHNHPSGFAVPSEQDIETTEKLQKALAGIGVILLDHLVFGDDDYISFADSGYIRLSSDLYQYYNVSDSGPTRNI